MPASAPSGPGEKVVDAVDGFPLWKLWTSRRGRSASRGSVCFRARPGAVDSERTEPVAAPTTQLLARDPDQLLEGVLDHFAEQSGRLVVVGVSTALGLGDDHVDHSELLAVQGIWLQGRGRFHLLRPVAPEDHRAAF